MFKPTKTFEWNVPFRWPEGGGFIDQSITVVFKMKDRHELADLNKDLPTPPDNVDEDEIAKAEQEYSDAMFAFIGSSLSQVVADVKGIELTDDNDQPLGTRETIDWCIGNTIVGNAMFREYQRAITGRELEQGN